MESQHLILLRLKQIKLSFQLKIGMKPLMFPSRRTILLMLLKQEAWVSLLEILLTLVKLVTQLLVVLELFLSWLSIVLLSFFSKKQGSCETSSFSSEFIAMKSCCENLRGFVYKLRIFGMLVEHIACVFADNQSVFSNSSKRILF